MYSTKYLRVLLRAGVADFSKWGLELLVTQVGITFVNYSKISL